MGNYFICQTYALCFICIYRVASKNEFTSLGHSDQSRQEVGTSEIRNEPDSDVDLSKCCFLGSYSDITGAGDVTACAQGRAIY